MTTEMVVWAVAVAGGAGFGVGLSIGLFVGERGRRLAAERWIVNGSPMKPGPVTRTTANGQAIRAQDAPQGREITKEEIDAGAAHLMAQASERGLDLNKEQARVDARRMLEEAEGR